MARLDDRLIEEIKDRIDIVDLVSDYVRLQRSGKNYKGLCPFHKEKTPSFSVDQEKQFFYCFGCHEGGNIYQFLEKIERLTFREAVERLADRAGVTLDSAEPTPAERRQRRLRERLLRANEAAAQFFQEQLMAGIGKGARRYLGRRGLNKDIALQFRLGYAPDGWDNIQKVLAGAVSPDEALQSGLIIEGKKGKRPYDRFRDRLMFPICDASGRVIGFGGRILGEGQPKYLNSPETPVFSKRRSLYGMDKAKEAMREKGKAVVVEGYTDVIGLHQFGIIHAVASLGTAFTENQARLLKRYADEVILAFDADTAGKKATERGLDILESAQLKVRVLSMPEGYDPDSYVRKCGADAFGQLLETSVPLVEFKLAESLRNHDVSRIDGRVAAVEAVLPVLATVKSAVEREEYAAWMAKRLDVSPGSILDEVDRFRSNQEKRGKASNVRNTSQRTRYTNRDFVQREKSKHVEGRNRLAAALEPPLALVEKNLIRMLIEFPQAIGDVRRKLGPDGFLHPPYRHLYQRLLELGDAGEVPSTGEAFLAAIEDEKLVMIGSRLLQTGSHGPAERIDEYIRKMRLEKLKWQLRDIEAKVVGADFQAGESRARIDRLFAEYVRVRIRLNED